MSDLPTIPHNLESEQGVLGCILLSPVESMGECCSQWGESVEMFHDLRNRHIYTRMLELYGKGDPIDAISVLEAAENKPGSALYLSSLQDKVPSAANLPYYIEKVNEKWALRRMLFVCQGIERKVLAEGADVDKVLDEAERDVLGAVHLSERDKMPDANSLVRTTLTTIEECFNRQGAISGLPTGFLDLDRMTSGLHAGEMFVLAARPSMGKTSLAMNIAEHVAVDQGKPVGVFSLEMTNESLMQRLICSRARVDLARVRDGRLHTSDFPRLSMVAGALAKSPMHIDDTSGLTILQLRARARRMHKRFGIELLVVDYLQLIRSRTKDGREREVADVSAGLKALSKELRIPVLVLSQLNRGVEREKDGKPRLSDLRESGAIEQDADLVALMYVDKQDDQQSYDGIPMKLFIAKQRNGPTGLVDLVFMREHTRFESSTKV